MKWSSGAHVIGDERVKKQFTWLPVKAGREKRWLEWVTIKQRYFDSEWRNLYFIDK